MENFMSAAPIHDYIKETLSLKTGLPFLNFNDPVQTSNSPEDKGEFRHNFSVKAHDTHGKQKEYAFSINELPNGKDVQIHIRDVTDPKHPHEVFKGPMIQSPVKTGHGYLNEVSHNNYPLHPNAAQNYPDLFKSLETAAIRDTHKGMENKFHFEALSLEKLGYWKNHPDKRTEFAGDNPEHPNPFDFVPVQAKIAELTAAAHKLYGKELPDGVKKDLEQFTKDIAEYIPPAKEKELLADQAKYRKEELAEKGLPAGQAGTALGAGPRAK
jgi:hypothetical protein